jgi:hypothetical protein
VATLGLADAVAVAGAAVAQSAARGLLIKGAAAETYQIRAPHLSVDVDIIVHPDEFADVLAALARWGWREREVSGLAQGLSTHSVSLVHGAWPCDVDVHRSFPGFLAEPSDVFEVLWRDRKTILLAGVPVRIPSWEASVLIQAAHGMRTVVQADRHADEFTFLVQQVLPGTSHSQRQGLLETAVELGAVDTLRPLLDYLDLPLPAPLPAGVQPDLDAWRERVAGRGVVTLRLFQRARRQHGYRRFLAYGRAAWPSDRDLRIDHPEIGPGTAAALRARVARLLRGLRALPEVARGRRAARKGTTINPFR